jgi:glycogen operon protein
MLLGGDEFGRSQGGNNNAWCQDNEISWFRWNEADHDLIDFTRRVIRLRKDHPVFRRQSFLTGGEVRGSGLPDVWWFRPDGRRMTQKDWQNTNAHTLGVFLNGKEISERTPDGDLIEDDSFLLLFNAYGEPITFTLPTRRFGTRWTVELATGESAPTDAVAARAEVTVDGRSIVLLKRA